MPRELVTKYAKQSRHYLENALRFLAEGEYGKASELLWGSYAQAIKAAAAKKNWRIRQHGEIGDVARQISKEIRRPDLHHAYFMANSLHKNFYENELRPEDIAIHAQDIRKAVGMLLGRLETSKRGAM